MFSTLYSGLAGYNVRGEKGNVLHAGIDEVGNCDNSVFVPTGRVIGHGAEAGVGDDVPGDAQQDEDATLAGFVSAFSLAPTHGGPQQLGANVREPSENGQPDDARVHRDTG